VIERKRIDHARFSAHDGEISFQKMMYQTYMAILRKYGQPNVLRAFHGRRESSYELSEFMKVFNNGTTRDFLKRGFYRPLRQMEYMNISKSDLHQVADLLLGAASWHWNKARRGSEKTPKGIIAKYIEANCPLERLDRPSPKSGCPQFHIWEFDWKLATRRPRSP